MRQTYVYRLRVEYWPYGLYRKPRTWNIVAPSLPPAVRLDAYHGYADWVPGGYRYPRHRHSLTFATAEKRANLLRSRGCRVTIERSNAVAWCE